MSRDVGGESDDYTEQILPFITLSQIVGFLRVWSPVPGERLPYLRSLTQASPHPVPITIPLNELCRQSSIMGIVF
jgi:hypothetical protein